MLKSNHYMDVDRSVYDKHRSTDFCLGFYEGTIGGLRRAAAEVWYFYGRP